MDSKLVFVVATYLGCIALAGGMMLVAGRWLVRKRERTNRRLQGNGDDGPVLAISPEYMERRIVSKTFDRWFNRLVREAGLKITGEGAFLAAVFVGLIPSGIVLLWRDDLFEAAAAMAAGMLVVVAYYLVLRRQRQVAMQEQLPDVMELLARAVRAGETLDQAIELVGDTTNAPLGIEFRRCARQLDMGLSVDAAMQSMARRVPLSEMRILATALAVQRKTGGSLPTTLERLSFVIRDRINYHRQFRAATGAGRVSAILIGSAGPLVAAYMLIWQREYFNRFTETLPGQVLLATAITLQLVGILWIYMLLRSDY